VTLQKRIELTAAFADLNPFAEQRASEKCQKHEVVIERKTRETSGTFFHTAAESAVDAFVKGVFLNLKLIYIGPYISEHSLTAFSRNFRTFADN